MVFFRLKTLTPPLMSLTLCPTDLQSTKKPGFFSWLHSTICISFYNIDWYIAFSVRLHFLIFIMNNKFFTFLLCFNHDRKYPNSIWYAIIIYDSNDTLIPLWIIKLWLAELYCTADSTRRKVNLNSYSQNRNSFAQLAQREKAVPLTAF